MRLRNIERKVFASTLASFAVGDVITILNDVENHHALLGSTPPALQAVILTFIPPVVTFLAGWAARHTTRTDIQPDPVKE